jgi:hypothetical protein
VNQEETKRAAKTFVCVSLINIISPIYFHLYSMRNGKDDTLLEEHFENSKIGEGSYLYQELFLSLYLISV